MHRPFPPPRSVERMLSGLASVLVTVYCVGVVALFASGRLDLTLGASLLGVPIVLGLALVRPEWMILVLVAVPPYVISLIPPMRLNAVVLATLFGFLLQGRLHLGPRTGVYPLAGIAVLAITVRAAVPTPAAMAADAMLKLIVFYTLLMLTAYHAVARGRLRIDTFLNALLVGIVAQGILQPFVGTISGFESITRHPFRGQFAYLAVMAFGVSYVRRSLRRAVGQRSYPVDSAMIPVFLCLTLIGYSRSAWIVCLSVFALVSVWTGRKTFWVVASLFLVLALMVPLIGGRILPESATGPQGLAVVTSGRSVLWEEVLSRGAGAFPLGNGWGYAESLTSTELFGFEGEFILGDNPFVFLHNDFLFLYVELGIIGLGLLVAYWLNLLQKIRRLARSRVESARYEVRVLIPIIMVMFIVQLFDNGFAIQAVATRFFIAAGLVFGMYHIVRERASSDIVEFDVMRDNQDAEVRTNY